MTANFHFLVRSPVGELSEGFRPAQNARSRRFNRRRRRDGALVRGRFFSKPVRDDRYRRTLVRYIDHNPVRADAVTRAEDYEFGSAVHYSIESGAPWLERSWVESEACRISSQHDFDLTAYRLAFPGLDAEGAELVERRLTCRVSVEGDWLLRSGRSTREGSSVVHVGLLRDLASSPLERIGRILGISLWSVRRRLDVHHEAMRSDAVHRDRVARIAHDALAMVT